MNKNSEDEVDSQDADVTEFFSDLNIIRSVIQKRRTEVEEKIQKSLNLLKFLDKLKEGTGWMHTYLDGEVELRNKIHKILKLDAKDRQVLRNNDHNIQKVNCGQFKI